MLCQRASTDIQIMFRFGNHGVSVVIYYSGGFLLLIFKAFGEKRPCFYLSEILTAILRASSLWSADSFKMYTCHKPFAATGYVYKIRDIGTKNNV